MQTQHTPVSAPPLPQFISMRDVRRMLGGAANATVNAMVASGTLPEPIRPRKNMVLFERGALLAAVTRLVTTA
jgi:hypothetical protein